MSIHPFRGCRRPLILAMSGAALFTALTGCAQEAPVAVPEPELTVPAVSTSPEPPQMKALREAIAVNPENAAAHHDLGRLLSEAEDHEEAITHLERAVQLSPSLNNLFDLGVACEAAMQLNQAEESFKRILVFSPDHAQTLHRLGKLELEMGHKETAIDYLWQAIQARPNNVMASYDLANIYKFYGEYEDAIGLYQSILPVEPRNADEQAARADSLYQLAAIEVARGKNEQAERLLDQLLQAVPNHPKAHYTRGQALMQLGRTDEAQVEFARHQHLLQQRPITSGME